MRKKIFVGLSGGVDSSVAAHILKSQGNDVVGVFIKTWQPDFIRCDSERERIDAMRVAASLEIPFLTCDAEEVYKREVGEYMVREYLEGRTPNPDVLCNRYVKFGVFWNFAQERGADAVATGHYARVVHQDGGYTLFRGVDTNKDQSYFLWQLTEDDLSHIVFPVGNMIKSEVRAYAQKNNIPVASKKDSQGICFLGQVDIEEFLSHYTNLTEGDVLDVSGKKIGIHKGARIYTLGQRHGFAVHATSTEEKPHFVIAKDVTANTITVSYEPPHTKEREIIKLSHVSWVNDRARERALLGVSFNEKNTILAQFRYRQNPFPVVITQGDYGITLSVPEGTDKPASGQSCVFYTREWECLGGGVVE